MSEITREDVVNDYGDSSKKEREESNEYRHEDQVYMSESRGFSIGELIDRDDLQNKSRNHRKVFKGL